MSLHALDTARGVGTLMCFGGGESTRRHYGWHRAGIFFKKLKTLNPWKWPFQSSINVFLKDK